MRPLLILIFFTVGVSAAEHVCEHCNKALLPKPTNPQPGRKYARDRLADLLHLKLDVTPDFERRRIAGKAEWKLKPIAMPLPKFTFDAVSLAVDSVTATGAEIASFENTDRQLTVYFRQPLPPDQETSIAITYQVEPENGLYFRTPKVGYKEGDTQLWTQGEAELHRYWFPCYDYPNERFTSEVVCHVPEGMEVISNGRLISSAKDDRGLKAVHWLQDKPHVNYLVALAAGYFHKLEDKAGDLPLALFVPPSEKDQAANAFLDTKNILGFFEKEIGVPFPWDKYYQVYCIDFLAGGMENTSCTFNAARLLFKSEDEQLSTLHRLDAHETAHQWFGDLVTCRDWSHLWLNEGFASYYTLLYEEQKNGRDGMLYGLWREAQQVLESTDTKPVVWRDYQDPMEQFDYRAYPKGAWVLHMMRSRLGADLYRQCIKAYLERHRNETVGTDDLHDVVEELSGLSWDQFFDQWLYHGGVPDLDIKYSYDQARKLAKVTVKQQQKLSEKVLLFALDLPVRFFLGDQQVNHSVKVHQAEEDFYFPLERAPELLRIDPEFTVLAKVQFTPSAEMLKRQIKGDMIGRMLAAQKLCERKDADSIAMLRKLLTEDTFFGVRSEAAKALKKAATDEARAALIAGVNQPDARARREVVQALAAFHEDDARDALLKLAQTEKNPGVLDAIIQTWGTRPGHPAIAAALREHLASVSYNEQIADAAISALRAQDDSSAVPLVLAKLQKSARNFESRSYAMNLDHLAFLARNDKDRDEVRQFLVAQLSNPKPDIQHGAAKALGTLNDPAAIAVLTPITEVLKPFNDPIRDAAAKSLEKLQANLDAPAETKIIMQRLDELQRKDAELRKQLEDLKKQTAPANK